MLWFKTYGVKSRKESCIRVNTRELNRVPSIKCLPYIHLANSLCLPNGNGYGEIDLKMDDMALQTTFPHPFNLSPILKPCITKEKSLAALSNVEQVTATLETTTDPQFLQKVYFALVKKKYKHISISSTCASNMRTTAKPSTISQTSYICQISLEQNKA